jgi:hypothetical protein
MALFPAEPIRLCNDRIEGSKKEPEHGCEVRVLRAVRVAAGQNMAMHTHAVGLAELTIFILGHMHGALES